MRGRGLLLALALLLLTGCGGSGEHPAPAPPPESYPASQDSVPPETGEDADGTPPETDGPADSAVPATDEPAPPAGGAIGGVGERYVGKARCRRISCGGACGGCGGGRRAVARAGIRSLWRRSLARVHVHALGNGAGKFLGICCVRQPSKNRGATAEFLGKGGGAQKQRAQAEGKYPFHSADLPGEKCGCLYCSGCGGKRQAFFAGKKRAHSWGRASRRSRLRRAAWCPRRR